MGRLGRKSKADVKNLADMGNVYGRIVALCYVKGVSISEMAVECGFAHGTLYSWSGRSVPNVPNFAAVADYLGVTMDYLWTGRQTTWEKEQKADLIKKIGA